MGEEARVVKTMICLTGCLESWDERHGKIIYRFYCILLGILNHLGCEIDGIVEFLKICHPENECILVGCRADPGISYECCEYDVIVLNGNGEIKNTPKKDKKKCGFYDLDNKKLEILLLDKESFFQNGDIGLLNYVSLTNSTLKSNLEALFEKKKRYSQKNIGVLAKRRSMRFALCCTKVNKQLSRNVFNPNLCSIYLKMMSFSLLGLLVQLVCNEVPKPTHLKYQMNAMKEKDMKTKEHVDTLSEYLELDRSNVSTITRSEKSLIFLMKHTERHNHEVDLFKTKVDFFNKKSMYVDGNLLVHSFVKKQNFDEGYIKNYSKIISRILDVQIKEKTVLSKELEMLFNINKSVAKNNY
jgi:hypothetical protein